MTESRKLRVFLCHASQDKPIVRELYQRLLAEEWIDPWLDEEKLLPGQDWDMEIEKAVEAADVVIVCASSRSVTKEGYIQRELKFALDITLEKPEGTIFIIPLRLDDCELPRRLRSWQYVDYFPTNTRDKAFGRVFQSLSLRRMSADLPNAFYKLKNEEKASLVQNKTNKQFPKKANIVQALIMVSVFASIFILSRISQPDQVASSKTATLSLNDLRTEAYLTAIIDNISTSNPAFVSETPNFTETNGLENTRLSTDPYIVSLYTNNSALFPKSPSEINFVVSLLDKKFPSNYNDQKAGLVIILGYHNDISSGMRMAEAMGNLLLSEYPEIFSESVIKTYQWSPDEINPIGTIQLEIYYLE